MKRQLEIERVEAFEVTVPIEAPLRHSYGVHEAFTRTIVKVFLRGGAIGLGETAASAAEVMQIGGGLVGLNAIELGVMRNRISHRFYWSKNPLVASAFEMACIDAVGKALGMPAHRLLGGALRSDVALAAYCFFRYETALTGPVGTPEEMALHARALVDEYGFETVKLKAGVLDPETEVDALAAIRDALPSARLRIDPNAAWTPSTAMGLLSRFEEIGLEYLEDPVAGQAGMGRIAQHTTVPLATNMCVIRFEDLPGAVALNSVDVVLSDLWYWGGPSATRTLAEFCGIHGLGMGMHSGIELGIGMAAMLHTAVTIPNQTLAMDAHYHHLTGDIIKGDRLLPRNGRLAPPEGDGWGVELDEDLVEHYREVHASGLYSNLYVTGDSGMGADRFRPEWTPVMPAW